MGPSARLFALKGGLEGGGAEGSSQVPAPLFLGGKAKNGAGTTHHLESAREKLVEPH